jgi:hypothetical protein
MFIIWNVPWDTKIRAKVKKREYNREKTSFLLFQYFFFKNPSTALSNKGFISKKKYKNSIMSFLGMVKNIPDKSLVNSNNFSVTHILYQRRAL